MEITQQIKKMIEITNDNRSLIWECWEKVKNPSFTPQENDKLIEDKVSSILYKLQQEYGYKTVATLLAVELAYD